MSAGNLVPFAYCAFVAFSLFSIAGINWLADRRDPHAGSSVIRWVLTVMGIGFAVIGIVMLFLPFDHHHPARCYDESSLT